MLEIEWAPMPQIEKMTISGLISDPWVLVGSEEEIENFGPSIERVDLFIFTYTTALSVDEFVFCRAHFPNQQEWIYFFDGVGVTGVITIAGLGKPNEETAIQMYLRIAEYTCERLPEKISCEGAFKADKFWLNSWSKIGYYKDFPEFLECDIQNCKYSLNYAG